MAKKKEQTTDLAVRPDQPPTITLPSFNIQLLGWADKIQQYEEDTKNIVIASPEQEGHAIDIGKAVKQLRDEAEDLRKQTVSPAKQMLKNIDLMFSTVTDRADASIRIIKEKILSFRENEERKRVVAQLKAEEEYAKKLAEAEKKAEKSGKEVKMPPPPLPPQADVSNQIAGKDSAGQVKKVWTFEIEDERDIPREYMTPDEKAIKQAISSGVRKIAGIKIYQKSNIAIS
jgi:hypothetical protein